jgi:hypothetical protein
MSHLDYIVILCVTATPRRGREREKQKNVYVHWKLSAIRAIEGQSRGEEEMCHICRLIVLHLAAQQQFIPPFLEKFSPSPQC